jgi:predicted flap endonuclease-1-like 5' DNA nuclease
MTTMAWVQANWSLVGLAVCAVLLLLWWLMGPARLRDRHRGADVLDEGVAPAARNEALIKAPSAAERVSLGGTAVQAAGLADTGPGLGGVGEVIAAAALVEVEAAGDDLTRIKGLGPKLRARLAELGVTRFEQIAAWTDADIAAFDAQLGSFAGRSTRDQWVAQAQFLASGDVAGYEAKFGKL